MSVYFASLFIELLVSPLRRVRPRRLKSPSGAPRFRSPADADDVFVQMEQLRALKAEELLLPFDCLLIAELERRFTQLVMGEEI